MKKEVEKLLPKALEAVPRFLFKRGTGKVEKEYDGYAASLGAAIRTSGLMPSLSFYTDVARDGSEEENNKPRRYKLLQAIAHTLNKDVDTQNKRVLLEYVLQDVYGNGLLDRAFNQNRNLPTIANYNPDKQQKKAWQNAILNASIALKLAMRNFPHSDE